ncbi:hypothetical protein JJV70_17165 [Streptomyces sp. JJ66]|uniref:hypothetical protein n=1 Tax=Streptomyces sp. JJ66 TaxID=2803843 RepID=UPI001C58120D|nr:hypothetical protein [Streptomyces sp. JJ66]MBW1603806.1 hypothetical protein [Streptomyces sp. JJ66]
MGWTYDQRDVSRNIPSRGAGSHPRPLRGAPGVVRDPRIGIPHLLGRRARWMGARLRHR